MFKPYTLKNLKKDEKDWAELSVSSYNSDVDYDYGDDIGTNLLRDREIKKLKRRSQEKPSKHSSFYNFPQEDKK